MQPWQRRARGFAEGLFSQGFLRKQKGFTLFTALVSILLIVLTTLLVQSMTRTERNTTDTIADVQEQQEMQAMADLARADAMQVFNFGIRYQIEQYLTNPQNSILITPETVSWTEFVRSFAIANFGGTESGVQFANRTANHLTNILGSGKGQDFKSFRLDLESNVEQMRTVLQKLFQESVKQDDFFEVIDCPNGEYKKCVGTFYVNLNMSKIGDEDYEKLPQIRVLNRDTGRVIKEPILPRSNFRIYVPLRIFKALAGAKALAHTPNNKPAGESGYIQDLGDFGLLGARVHNEIEELKLGLCDPASCAARTDPYKPASHDTVKDNLCPGSTQTDAPNNVALNLDLGQLGIGYSGSYDVTASQSMNEVLKEILKQRVNFLADAIAAQYGIGADKGFDVQRISAHVLTRVDAGTGSEVSKNLIEGLRSGSNPASGGVTSPGYPNESLGAGAQCPVLAEGVGAYFGRDAEGNWEPKTEYVPLSSCQSGVSTPGLCAEAREFDAYVVFVENDNKYKVNKNNDNTYTIRLHDGGFTGFTHRYAPAGRVCSLPQKPVERSCSDAALDRDWTCVSVYAPASPGGSETRNCYTQGST